ncbi:MAG TPA: methyltransferase [Candidatus Binatia bacterium]|nr:methyltransferase [Candidatus Binatia bacterium]
MLWPSQKSFRSRPPLALFSLLAGVLSLLLLAAHSVAYESSDASPKTFKGRVIAPAMSYQGADWLERADREATEQPEKVLDALNITPGSTVADIGAGTGYFSIRLAKRVGPQGRVLATDIQPQMLALLSDNMRAAGIHNIEPILCTPTDAKLPEGQLDLALMVDVYHELAYPQETVVQVRRALKPEGRLVLIEYRGEDPNVPIKSEHKLTLVQARSELEPMGFQLKEVFEFLVYQRVIVFKKTMNDE